MLSQEWDPNVWKAESKGLAFKTLRFLEVYSENSLTAVTSPRPRELLFRGSPPLGLAAARRQQRRRRRRRRLGLPLLGGPRHSPGGVSDKRRPSAPRRLSGASSSPNRRARSLAPRKRAGVSAHSLSRNRCMTWLRPPGRPWQSLHSGNSPPRH